MIETAKIGFCYHCSFVCSLGFVAVTRVFRRNHFFANQVFLFLFDHYLYNICI